MMEFETILPAVQNDENQSLEEQIRSGRERLTEITLETEEQERRTELMKEHLEQALQSAAFNQQLSGAVLSEAETELNLLQIRLKETDWANREVTRMNRDMKEIHQRLDSCQRSLMGKRRRLQDLQSALVWESEACQEWLGNSIGTTQRHLDALRVQKEAAAFLRELNCEVHKLQGQLTSWKKNQEDISSSYHNLQAELCRTSDEFSSNHQDRQNALKLWEGSVRELQAVETDLDTRSKDLESLRSEWSRQQLLLFATRQSLSREVRLQGSLTEQFVQLSSAVAILHEQLGDGGGVTIKAELQALRQEVSVCSLDERSLRGQLAALRGQLADKLLVVSNLKDHQNTLNTCISKQGPTKAVKELNLLRNLVEREKNAQERCSVSKLRDLCGEKENFMQTLKEQRTAAYAQVQNCDTSFRTREAQINKSRKTLEEKMMLLFNLNSNIQVLEKRYQRMTKGSGENGVKSILVKGDLKNLELALKGVLSSKRALEYKLHQTTEECEKVLKGTSKLCCEHTSLEETVALAEQDTEALEAWLARLRKDNKEQSIDNSLSQVTVRQMQYLLEDSNQDVASAQEQKQKLQVSLAHKLKIAKNSADSLQSLVNAAQNERHKLCLRNQKEKGHLEGLKTRLEVSTTSVPVNLNENCPSAVIEKALELQKIRLEQEDVVDVAVIQGQRDLFQLQGYMQTLLSANSKTRNRLRTKDPECEQEVSELESELRHLLQTLYCKRKALQLSNKHLETMKAESMEVHRQRENVKSLTSEVTLRERKVRLTLEEQERKIQRAEQRTGVLTTQGDNTIKQKQIQLLLLRRVKQTMKTVLTQEARKYPDFYMTLHALLQ